MSATNRRPHRFPLTKRAPRQGKLATRLRGCCQKASGMSLRESIRSCSFEVYLRTLGDDSAVFPNVERRSVHSRGTPRRFPGTHQRSSHTGGKLRVPVRGLHDCLAFHGPDSIRVGGRVELSYTVHASANGRYVVWSGYRHRSFTLKPHAARTLISRSEPLSSGPRIQRICPIVVMSGCGP